MIRYGQISSKNKREIVLLKGYPCMWNQCAFCDYVLDNSQNELEMLKLNEEVLQHVTGEYGALEIINSGSVFELPQKTLDKLKELAKMKGINRLYFESYYGYKDRLYEIRELFEAEIIFKCGIETFNHEFRNNVLKKGIFFDHPKEVAEHFESVCLLVGIEGQTKEMIRKDIEVLTAYFPYGCINLYINNSTPVKADEKLKAWFKETYGHLDEYPNVDVLWENTDFGVGGELI